MKGCKIALILLVMTLCYAQSAVAADDERKALSERAKAYWELYVKGDYSEIYRKYLPLQFRELVSEENYTARAKDTSLTIVSFKIGDVEVSGNTGWVQGSFDLALKQSPGKTMPQKDRWTVWTKIAENWYPVSQKDEAPELPPRLRALEQEATLRSRAEALWKAMVEQDFAGAYELTEPSYRKEATLEEFKALRPMYIYLAFTIDWVEVKQSEMDHGKVRVTYTCRPNDPSVSKAAPMIKNDTQDWYYIDGHWYRPAKKSQ